MFYAALEFDHRIAQAAIRWIVVACESVGRKCGGPIALPPRHDVAYFLDHETAEQDAHSFAQYKNWTEQSSVPEEFNRDVVQKVNAGLQPAHHYAYPWDHKIFYPTLGWGVFQWSGDNALSSPRIDVAYFVDEESAESDAKVFAFQREQAFSFV